MLVFGTRCFAEAVHRCQRSRAATQGEMRPPLVTKLYAMVWRADLLSPCHRLDGESAQQWEPTGSRVAAPTDHGAA
jgi:hypothetical protein